MLVSHCMEMRIFGFCTLKTLSDTKAVISGSLEFSSFTSDVNSWKYVVSSDPYSFSLKKNKSLYCPKTLDCLFSLDNGKLWPQHFKYFHTIFSSENWELKAHHSCTDPRKVEDISQLHSRKSANTHCIHMLYFQAIELKLNKNILQLLSNCLILHIALPNSLD